MASHKHLGIHWGERGVTLVEVVHGVPAVSAFVPFPQTPGEGVLNTSGVSREIQILEVLQKAVRNKGFSTVDTSFSIPSKDIVIRWFVIPWMKSSEIHSVVAFEAKKYVPFPIEEMSYTYYPTTLAANDLRQIGILFVAIRKDVLERYAGTLIQSGMNLGYSEPAPMSLLRALVFRKIVNPDQLTAIVHVDDHTGEILIASKGYVKFIRDFKIQSGSVDGAMTGVADDDVLRARLFNEIRISFEFFSRQYGGAEVDKMVVIATALQKRLWEGVSEDTGVNVEIVDISRLIERGESNGVFAAHAFGAAMAGEVSSVIDFNLFEGAQQQVSLKKEEIERRNRQLVFPLVIGVLIFLVITGMYIASGILFDRMRADIAAHEQKIGVNVGMAQDEADAKRLDEQQKLQALQSLPLKSRVTPLLIRLVKRLPAGVWFDGITLTFKDTPEKQGQKKEGEFLYSRIRTKAGMVISGFAYQKDNNTEFETVNKFVNTLRSDDVLGSFFAHIDITALKVQELKNKRLTAFTIVCEGQ